MGLTEEEVIIQRKKSGSNELVKIKKRTFLNLLIESLGDPIIKILLLALALKVIFLFRSFDWFETIGILAAVFMATFISSLSEYGSESAFARLQSENAKIKVKVYRNNVLKEVCIDEIVTKDLVMLTSGDKVPADGYLIEGKLSIDESSLNGESKESKKESIKNNTINYNNKVFRGTVVYSGNAKIIVSKVGMNTIYGNISKELQEKNVDSPLKIRLRKLAKSISKLGYAGAALVFLIYLFTNIVVNNNYDIDLIKLYIFDFEIMADLFIHALTISITIIVVAVPEGLPMMITLVLSSNMKKMLKDNVLVRQMVGVETAGNINYLLTDKTGTLTKGMLLITQIIDAEGKRFRSINDFDKYPLFLKTVFYSLYYNNESKLSNDKIIGGNQTDKACLNFVKKKYFPAKILNKEEFRSEKKYSKVTIMEKEKRTFIKGAYEVILNKCNSYIDKKNNINKNINKVFIKKQISNYINKGSRAIALAEIIDDEYVYIGFVVIKDELRTEAIEGVKLIQKAGINIIMITGDAKETAMCIAKEVGILKNNEIVLTSDEFNKLDTSEIKKILPKIKVIARALPQDKSKLVKIIQEESLVVGMTGDGVNDAPALKKSNVAFAMGSGTEVAKEASEIVILDDNILSISKAILYGRTIFKSIRKFIIYQLSINICALIISIVGTLIGISEPITIIQMLWLNMIMDTFAGLAFAFESPLKEYMDEKPKSIKESILNKYMLSQIVLSGMYSSLICLLFLKLPITAVFLESKENLYTAYFALFIFLGVFNAFNARTTRINIFANLLKNKIFIIIFILIIIMQLFIIYYGGDLFRTYGLTFNELIIVLTVPLSVFPLDIARKIYFKSKGIKSLV